MVVLKKAIFGNNILRQLPNIVVGTAMFLIVYLTSYSDEWETTSAYSIALIISFIGVVIILVINSFLKKKSIDLSRIDIVLIILFFYGICLLFLNFSIEYAYYNIKWPLLYAAAYYMGRGLTNNYQRTLLFQTIFFIAVSQSIWAVCQAGDAYFYKGFSFNRLSTLLKGCFSNSSMLACFMAIGSILGVFLLHKGKSIISKAFIIFCIILMVSVLLTTTSRAAILMLVLGIVILFRVKKRYIVIGAFIMFFALISVKKDSVAGRVLIWKVSMEMISENPIFGIGINRFGAEYNNYQGRYFLNNEVTEKEKMVASDNFYAFNLPLKIWVELGIIGLILYVFLILKTIKIVKKHTLLEALLSAFFIFSLFSYPLAQLETSFLFFVLIGTAASLGYKMKITTKNNYFNIKVVISILLFFGIYKEARTISFIKKWKQYNGYRYSSPAMAMKLFEKINPELKGFPEFLYAHSTLLATNNSNQKAIGLLEECSHKIPTSNLYSYLGITYGEIKKDSLAEYNHCFACNIVPNKFVPKYYLFLFYRNTGQTDLAKGMAKTILEQPIKIKSKKVNDIIEEVSIFIQN